MQSFAGEVDKGLGESSMENKKKKVYKIILWVLLVLTLAFIFRNSVDSQEESSEKSGWVFQLVQPILGFFLGEENVTVHLIRKLAHFVEFFLLGAELSGLCMLYGKSLVFGAFAGLLGALTDETVQIFTGRGPQVQDVWLDFGGVVTAILLSLAICALSRRFFKK